MSSSSPRRYRVNRPGWEVVRQSLYDFRFYFAAGHAQLAFFAAGLGQHHSGFAIPKHRSLTNMTVGGELPENQEFLVQSIEVHFLQNQGAVGFRPPAVFVAQSVAAMVNDAYRIGRTGCLRFVIGGKTYLEEAPLGRFPPQAAYEFGAALADVSTSGANMQSRAHLGVWRGPPYVLSPADLLLTSKQNFGVTLNWPEGPQPIVIGTQLIGVVLDGILYRRSQ